MRTIALLALLLLATLYAWTQNPNTEFKHAIKLNNRSIFGYYIIETPSGREWGGSYVNLFHLAPSFLMRTAKGNFTEFTLDNVSVNFPYKRTYDGETYQPYNTNVQLMAARFLTLGKASFQRWVPMIGIALAPAVSSSRFYQPVGGLTIRHSRGASLATYLAPRIAYFTPKRLFIDFTANINLMTLGYSYQSRETLGLPSSLTTSAYTYLRLIYPAHRFQLGLGIKL
jgi:hypothetical protein